MDHFDALVAFVNGEYLDEAVRSYRDLTGTWGTEVVSELRDRFHPVSHIDGNDPVDEAWMAELEQAVADTVVAFAKSKGWHPDMRRLAVLHAPA